MSIIRVFHNRQNPYVMLNKSALWDEELPLEAVGLWARCMSRPDNWIFRTCELAKSCKINVGTMQKYIKILIDTGYVARIDKKAAGNRFSGSDYIFFEFKLPKEEIEEFKKSLPNMVFPCTELPALENPHLLSKESSSSEEEVKKEKKEKQTENSVDASASRLFSLFLAKMREILPTHKKPNEKEWTSHFDKMLRLDARTQEQVRDLIEWWPTGWWRTRCASPKSMRTNFDKMMLCKIEDADSKVKDVVKKNKNYLNEFKKTYPESAKTLRVNEEGARNAMMPMRGTAHFDSSHEEFVKSVTHMFDDRRG